VPSHLWEAHREAHKNAAKPSPSARGYGSEHERARERWRPFVEAGQVVCRRCERPIVPGEPWHLGHDDEHPDPANSRPEHAGCNQATAGRISRRQRFV
jgi:hypothetical protein